MQFEVHRRPDRPFFLACFFILVFSAIFSNSTLGFSMPRLRIKWRACSSKCDLESALLSHPLLQNAEPMMCIQEHNIMYYVVTSWPSWSHTQLYWCGWYTWIRMSTLYLLSSAEWDIWRYCTFVPRSAVMTTTSQGTEQPVQRLQRQNWEWGSAGSGWIIRDAHLSRILADFSLV